MALKIFYRLGMFNERSLFLNNKEFYDGIVIKANILEFYEKAATELLTESEKPYIIDPITFIFLLEPDYLTSSKGNLKKPYVKLKEKYGYLINDIIGKRRIESADFKIASNNEYNNELIDNFISSVLSFQVNKIHNTVPQIKKYAEMLKGEDIESKYPELFKKFENIITSEFTKPYCIVPPYFPASSVQDPFYEISLYIAKRSIKFKNDNKLFPVIALSKEMIMDPNIVRKVVNDYNDEGFDGFLIWIVNFNDEKEYESALAGFASLILNFKRITKKEIINLYSGYYSVLLSYLGIDGIVSNICYGTFKKLEFGAGFRPPIRYYIPHLHRKEALLNAARYYENSFNKWCKCDICKDIKYTDIKSFLSEVGISLDDARTHFMINRKNEIINLNPSLRNEISEILRNYNESDKEIIEIEHLKRWSNILTRILNILEKRESDKIN